MKNINKFSETGGGKLNIAEEELSRKKEQDYLTDIEKLSFPELVKKYGEAWLLDRLKQSEIREEKNKELEKKLKKVEKREFGLRFDQLTNLEHRVGFYERINYKIKSLIKNPNICEIFEQDFIHPDDMENLKKLHLTVAMADLAYLTKYNDDPKIRQAVGGIYEGGDLILKKTAALIGEVDRKKQEIKYKLNLNTRGYRLGGDEFGLIIETSLYEADKIIKELKLVQSEIIIPEADLRPSINIENAHISEGIEVFMKVTDKKERQKMTTENKTKKIQSYLTKIADRRVSVQKGVERIELLIGLLKKDEKKFNRNFKWLQKGAFGLEKKRLIELGKIEKEDPYFFVNMVKKFLTEENQKTQSKKSKEYSIIIHIADKKIKDSGNY